MSNAVRASHSGRLARSSVLWRPGVAARADADGEFRKALQAWWEQASKIQVGEAVTSTVSGGI
jgi:hypothetical protein